LRKLDKEQNQALIEKKGEMEKEMRKGESDLEFRRQMVKSITLPKKFTGSLETKQTGWNRKLE